MVVFTFTGLPPYEAEDESENPLKVNLPNVSGPITIGVDWHW
jgi:hypothetical protein